jgi:adenine phosphoribosyltransferase
MEAKMTTDFRSLIRDVEDFPKPGIVFKDITPVLADPEAFSVVIDTMADLVRDLPIDCICGMESRGFIFGPPLALKLGLPFVPVRKKGKLPRKTESVTYELEYGTDILEIHSEDVVENANHLIVDDLIATGGTAVAAANLVERCGGRVSGMLFFIELSFLNGRGLLEGRDVFSVVSY